MKETTEDLAWLQTLLDDSYGRAGTHLTGIHTASARVTAPDLVAQLTGMQVFVVATVSSDGRPFTGPVDAFLYRGRVHFGTSPHALRARHLRRSPAVSATHVRGERLVVTAHGLARTLDLRQEPGFVEVLRGYYGPEFVTSEDLSVDPISGEAAPYFCIEPDRMFAADMGVHLQAAAT